MEISRLCEGVYKIKLKFFLAVKKGRDYVNRVESCVNRYLSGVEKNLEYIDPQEATPHVLSCLGFKEIKPISIIV